MFDPDKYNEYNETSGGSGGGMGCSCLTVFIVIAAIIGVCFLIKELG